MKQKEGNWYSLDVDYGPGTCNHVSPCHITCCFWAFRNEETETQHLASSPPQGLESSPGLQICSHGHSLLLNRSALPHPELLSCIFSNSILVLTTLKSIIVCSYLQSKHTYIYLSDNLHTSLASCSQQVLKPDFTALTLLSPFPSVSMPLFYQQMCLLPL